MNYKDRIEEAISNSTSNIAFLSRLPDTKPERKLNIVQEQIKLSAGNTGAFELLKIWERQIIEAPVLKHEQQPELNELSEIETELVQMEEMDRLFEKRIEVLKPVAYTKEGGRNVEENR